MVGSININAEERVIIDFGNNGDNNITANQYTNYYVKTGDSLYKIALNFGVTVDSIMRINNIHSHLIYPGQKLTIAVAVENNNIIYTVRSGDSLYLISLRHGVSIDMIKNINNLSSDMIYVGQRLEIPSQDNSNNDRFYRVSGEVILNNKTRSTNIAEQIFDFKNKVFPLNDNSNSKHFKENELIVKYKPMINRQLLEEIEKENNLFNISSVDRAEGKIVKYQISEDQELDKIIEEYNKKEEVVWAEPNYIYYPTAIPNDQFYNNYQWGMININMEASWDLTTGNDNVIVAAIDTGVIPDHPDLKDNLLQGADFIGGVNTYPIESYRKTDSDPTDETPYEKGGSHGTHVAGIIGAVGNNNIGVAGVNWNVKILPIRALTNVGGTSWDIAEGIYYAIDQGADIINMSFGSNYNSFYQEEAVKKAVSNGITIVAATGNEGSSVYYPAAYSDTIAVGAVGKGNTKTAYSNYGSEVDIVAPGGDYGESIISTWGYYRDGYTIADYTGMIGTSMATPFVSGVAALLVANGVDDPEEIKSRLFNTARDLGEKGKDNLYGYGLVDAYAALLNKKIENPVVFAAKKVNSNIYVKSEIIEALNDDIFSLKKISSDADLIIAWFDSNDNNIIDAGDYYGEIKFNHNNNNNNIKINMPYLPKSSVSPYYKVIK